MSIILPTSKVAPQMKSPKVLIIFSKPKTGKTKLLAALDNCLILDLEKGTKYIDALKVEAETFEEIREIGKAIKEKEYPYKYIAVDTVTALEEIIIPYAEVLYSKSPMGKNWFNPGGGKEKYGNILGMPEGAGYFWTRQAFTKVTDYISTWAPRIILVGHVKDTQLEKDGAVFSSMDLDLTGKLKRITSSNADAIGYLYRKGKKNIISFKTNDEVACGARPEHLSNQEIIISEIGENGEYITHWDKVFID
jgi:energy-coupling factor transporter ATP-binding protein EcfA2